MKKYVTGLVMAIIMIASFSSCSEYNYRHKHHEHSPEYNARHHHDDDRRN